MLLNNQEITEEIKEEIKKAEYTFLSSAHGTFSRTGHILGHKTKKTNLRVWKLFQASFLTTQMKLEISHRKRNNKKTIIWRLNNMPLKHQLVNDEIKEEI